MAFAKSEFLSRLNDAVGYYGHICSAMGESSRSSEGQHEAAADAAKMADLPAQAALDNPIAHAIVEIDHPSTPLLRRIAASERAWECYCRIVSPNSAVSAAS
jgi:hypothetical protein